MGKIQLLTKYPCMSAVFFFTLSLALQFKSGHLRTSQHPCSVCPLIPIPTLLILSRCIWLDMESKEEERKENICAPQWVSGGYPCSRDIPVDYTKVEGKEPSYLIQEERDVSAGLLQEQMGPGEALCWSHHRVQVVLWLTFKQGLAPAAAPSAWLWHEPRPRLCLQEHSQRPAAPTNWSWVKPKLSNTGFPSSPTDLRHLWVLGLGGQKGPWWQEGLFKSLNRLCASWASLPGSWCLSKKQLPGK